MLFALSDYDWDYKRPPLTILSLIYKIIQLLPLLSLMNPNQGSPFILEGKCQEGLIQGLRKIEFWKRMPKGWKADMENWISKIKKWKCIKK